jgi:hypothetical protein
MMRGGNSDAIAQWQVPNELSQTVRTNVCAREKLPHWDASTQHPLIPAPQLQLDGGVATRLSHQQQRAKVTADPQRLQLY